MALGIYKPGQGYWVRIMTASFMGLLVVATAGWAWSQGLIVADNLPTTQWGMRATFPTSQVARPAPGDQVTLYGQAPQRGAERPVLGTASIKSFDIQNNYIVVNNAAMNADLDPSQTRFISREANSMDALVDNASSVASIQPLYIQGSAAIVVFLLGSVLVYWLVGLKRGVVDFLVATDMEMRKVNWSTRQAILGQTWVVIITSFALAGILFFFDQAMRMFFQFIKIIES